MRLRFTVSDADTPSVNFHVYRFYARKRCFRPTVLRSKVLTGLDGRAAQSQEAEQKEQTLPAALHLHHQAEEDAHSGGVTVIPTSHQLVRSPAHSRRSCTAQTVWRRCCSALHHKQPSPGLLFQTVLLSVPHVHVSCRLHDNGQPISC